ncbi:MAG: class I SAM-dependent methyltransferase [Bacillota bacterium]
MGLIGNQKTLLVPLCCRAAEAESVHPIISDPWAVRILRHLDFDCHELQIPQKTRVMLCMRAKQFDRWVARFMERTSGGTVIQLGCGLDSRFARMDDGRIHWYDLDMPEVVRMRRRFFPPTKRYHLIPSSVTEHSWMETLPVGRGPFLVVAEGLFMYLREEEVRSLILTLRDNLGEYDLAFDAYGKLTARTIGAHPSIRSTGGSVRWGLGGPHELEVWDEGIQLEEEWFFTESQELPLVGPAYRLAFSVANLFGVAKRAHWLIYYRVRG